MEKNQNSIVQDQRGAGFTEYLILVGLIAIICITAFGDFGEAVEKKTNDFRGEIETLGDR
jgi:Flp pilus assembly pilin Flp